MTSRRWTLTDMNQWHVAAADLRGKSLAEAEAIGVEALTRAHECLEDYEIALATVGGDPADHAAIQRRRAELLAEDREQMIAKMRAVVLDSGGRLS